MAPPGGPARLARALLDLLLPPVCAGCRVATGPEAPVLCRACLARLPVRPADDPPPPPPLRAVAAGAPLEDGWAEWVHRFKYPAAGLRGLDPGAEAVAGALVRRAARRAPGPPDAVLPMALHPARVRARGLHPPALLARAVAREAGRPLRPGLLRRVRDTPSQTGLARDARRRNVAGAFRASGRCPPRVWLVDDVVTTGATLAEAARTLRRAGAREVVGICAARTPAPPG
ncbi:MAG: ComF family protein [Myxococcota bacterium]|nr:ComF family protein [Myxococcota bacterium]